MTMIDQILKIIPRIGLANCKMNQIICYYLPPSAAVMPLIRPKLKTLDTVECSGERERERLLRLDNED